MTINLGLDIGSNSVGSAWIDTDAREITLGVSVFPAGVDESDTKRGEPKNQDRREKRSLRRSLARRAERKHRLRRSLTQVGLLPADPATLASLMSVNPWHLRRKGLHEPLTPHEFGRALVHLNQRRGALGVETDRDDEEKGAITEAIDRTRKVMNERNAATFGQMMADLYDDSQHLTSNGQAHCRDSIRNRGGVFNFHADRTLILDEFHRLWEHQKSVGGELARLLTDELRRQLDDPTESPTWRHRGEVFGQRRTYWKTGTLGRCDLEPTDRCVPHADMHAQEFRVIETVNNVRITKRSETERALTREEREKVIEALRKQKTGSVATIRKALGIDKKAVKEFFTLNIERDKDREINTDWFYREFVHGVFTEERWTQLDEPRKESVNRAILKFDPDNQQHEQKLRSGAGVWWELDAAAVDRLISAWKTRPKLEKRLKLSRGAILNLLPYMNKFDEVNKRWPTQIEARVRFAEDRTNAATYEQRVRYDLGGQRLTKRDRQFLDKHKEPIPPAPMLANPVVRKAIHEVRRHVLAYWRKYQRRPDRIVIELAREAKQSERVRNERLAANRSRDKERKAIIEEYNLGGQTLNQQRAAVDRVILCRQQTGVCAYSSLDTDHGVAITEGQAAAGTDVETDHIVPLSRSQDNGLNNKVLCYRQANRNKGNQTAKEWLPAEQFQRLLQRFARWKTEQPRKWENLNRDAPAMDAFVSSQLTDTAYAARQVAEFLKAALYGDDADNRQRIFFTKGGYTAQLRRDWQLQDDAGPKPRVDHRHHAIDAAVIALTTPERLQDLARFTEEQERARTESDRWPKRRPLPPPWGTVESFRAQLLNAVGAQVLCHRPVKRKIIGAFHEETLYGPVITRQGVSETLFTNRIRAEALTSNHLRVPDGSDALSDRLHEPSTPEGERKALRTQMAALPDPAPAKSGIVRDRTLRDQIRRCLHANNLDPDHLTKDAIKRLVMTGGLAMSSGVPIKRVILLRTIKDPVLIPRKRWDSQAARFLHDDDPRTLRAYIGGSNHHIEIREDAKTGKWTGEVIDTFTAAQRVRTQKRAAVDRSDDVNKGGRFVMSLAEGETIHMRHPDTGKADYFVVFKLDRPRRIHFVHHWDARPAKVQKDDDGKEIPGSSRDEVAVVVSKLKDLGPEPAAPPYKVRVSPLGEVTRLDRD